MRKSLFVQQKGISLVSRQVGNCRHKLALKVRAFYGIVLAVFDYACLRSCIEGRVPVIGPAPVINQLVVRNLKQPGLKARFGLV